MLHKKRSITLIFSLIAMATALKTLHAQQMQTYWNQFRGRRGNGVSSVANLPIEFDEAKNVRWKILIPNEGWSSPVVWGNEIYLTTGSDEKKELRAICVDLQHWKIVKDIKVFDLIERKVDPAYKADYPREPYEDPKGELTKVKCSVLMIHGLKDKALLTASLNDTRKWIKEDLTLVTLPDSGHFVQQEAADAVTRMIVS